MKNIFAGMALLLFALSAHATQANPSETFLMAQAAYDAGHYTEAVSLYTVLASNGIDNIELHYNLANAYFKDGNLPEAVLHYRKAWYRTPRDPDIRANLHFALNAAGAAEPPPSFPERLFNILSQSEWIAATIGSYMAITLLLILGTLIRPARRMLFKASLIPAAIALVALGGWRHWKQFETHPEWVVVKSGATALFGPVEGATAHYKVPLAAIIRQRSTDSKKWVEIEYDGENGWLQEEYIRRVSP